MVVVIWRRSEVFRVGVNVVVVVRSCEVAMVRGLRRLRRRGSEMYVCF